MALDHLIETYRFWDVTTRWARERLVHEVIVARVLARGIVCDGLRMESTDPKWLPATGTLLGYPYVGYTAAAGGRPVILRAEALEHLLAIVHRAAEPERDALHPLFVTKAAFRDWLSRTGELLPAFWFSAAERASAPSAG